MKSRLLSLLLITLTCVSCFVVRTNTDYNTNYSSQLDLRAVSAAFSQSTSISDFENILNNPSYGISNLDLNRDGYIDYLRVLEVRNNYDHYVLVQAVLGDNIFQDVATIIVNNPRNTSFNIEIIGDPYIYGPNYYLRPVYVSRPPVYAHFYRTNYAVWSSPWYWGHYPTGYRRRAPGYVNNYTKVVNVYVNNCNCCRSYDYPKNCRYSNYTTYTSPISRNDYGQKYPERSSTTYRTPNSSNNRNTSYSSSSTSRSSSTGSGSTSSSSTNKSAATRSAGSTRSTSSTGTSSSSSSSRRSSSSSSSSRSSSSTSRSTTNR